MIPINPYSRTGKKLKEVRAIVIHWPFWSCASAQTIHDYFANIAGEKRYASSQYVVGLQGEILSVMPEDELAYHCGSSSVDPKSKKVYTDLARELFGEYASIKNSPNYVTIGIEVCHIDVNGTMTDTTINALRNLCIRLCNTYSLDPITKLLRHYDIVGCKSCPKYWCDNPEEWEAFKQSVKEGI